MKYPSPPETTARKILHPPPHDARPAIPTDCYTTPPSTFSLHFPQPWDATEFMQRRSIGVDVSRPFPVAVRAANFVGWILIFVGMMEIIIGAVTFNGE